MPSIPGALVFVTPTDTQSLLQELNRTKVTIKKQQIICLSTTGVEEAARSWWFLVTAGYRKVSVLNGGFSAWQSAGLPTSHIEHFMRTSDSFTGYFMRRNSGGKVKETKGSESDMQLLSTLPGDELISDLLTPDGLLKPHEELKGHLTDSAVRLDDEVTTVVTGEQAGTLLLALKIAGLNRLALLEVETDDGFSHLQSKATLSGFCSVKDEPLTSYQEVTMDLMTPISFTEIDLTNGAKNYKVLKVPSDHSKQSSSVAAETSCACLGRCLIA
jgi:hypothetical protein